MKSFAVICLCVWRLCMYVRTHKYTEYKYIFRLSSSSFSYQEIYLHFLRNAFAHFLVVYISTVSGAHCVYATFVIGLSFGGSKCCSLYFGWRLLSTYLSTFHTLHYFWFGIVLKFYFSKL